MEAIAAAAGISRSTLYRHWSDLPTLIFAAIEHIAPLTPAPSSATPTMVIRAAIESLGSGLRSGVWASISPALAEAASRDPAMAELHAAYVAARRKPLLRAVKAAQRSGEISSGVDAEWLVTSLAAPLYYHHLVLHRPMSADAVGRHVDVLLTLVGPR
jgi:AcrR family transcriptional regulator